MPHISNRLRQVAIAILCYASASISSPLAFGAGPQSHWQCDAEGSIRSEFMGQQKIEKSSYCWSDESVVSYACVKQRANCKVFKIFPISESAYLGLTSPNGNPYFHLCLLADGAPKFIDYKTPQGWKSTSVCEFDEDGSFATIKFWKSSSVEVK